jgi:hypothetical protein
MRTVDDIEVSFAQFEPPRIETRLGLFDRLERRKWLVMVCLIALAFGVRIYRLGAASLAEDEANKMYALRAYEQGDFTVNAEHPMVMKMLCYAAMQSANAWNAILGTPLRLSISEEAALRLPNVLFGALTVVPLLLLAAALFDFRIGFIATLLWATGLDAIWFNRVVKEDTLLVFFMLSGFYLYNRAKSSPAGSRREERLYALAGAAFGLMMASKYFPHYYGLNAIYYMIIGYDSRNNRPNTRRLWGRHFGGMILAFAAFNWAAFVPQTWRYLWKYINEDLVTHHGYVVMGKLFINDFGETPGGNPWYIYFLFLLIKVPLPILIAFAVGLFEIFRHRGPYPIARGYLFLRVMLVFWLFPMSLVGAKFLRYTLSLMPLLYITAALGIVMTWRWLSAWIKQWAFSAQAARLTAAVALALIFVVTPVVTMLRNLPFPNLYMNVIGGTRAGYFFPHDEFYDLGARESIRYIADSAPPGARMATEIPGVVEYYLQRYNRPDIHVEIMSQPSFTLKDRAPDYVLLQPGRVYFENQENYDFIERTFPVVQSSDYDGATAARVYKTSSP